MFGIKQMHCLKLKVSFYMTVILAVYQESPVDVALHVQLFDPVNCFHLRQTQSQLSDPGCQFACRIKQYICLLARRSSGGRATAYIFSL